jgi:hypothetical protein
MIWANLTPCSLRYVEWPVQLGLGFADRLSAAVLRRSGRGAEARRQQGADSRLARPVCRVDYCPMPRALLECQTSKFVDSDACPRPTTDAPPHAGGGGGGVPPRGGDGGGRARSRCRPAPPQIHFIPDSRMYSVPLFLARQCDGTPGGGREPAVACGALLCIGPALNVMGLAGLGLAIATFCDFLYGARDQYFLRLAM